MKLSAFPKDQFRNGVILRHVIVEDAQKTLPPGTEYAIGAWDSKEGHRMVGWVVEPETDLLDRNFKEIERLRV